MKNLIAALAVSITCLILNGANAQTLVNNNPKAAVYGEFGLGFGQTLFFGDIKKQLVNSYGGGFDPGTGQNIMMGFYVSPEKWKGLGIGSRIKGTFGSPVNGDNGDTYIFNYYNLAVSAKYYPFSKQFNKGFYGRASVGFGQFTTKRQNESANFYRHQYALGASLMGGIGYTFPTKKKMALSVETEFDYSNRTGTIDGKGNTGYQSGQLGVNVIVSF